MALLKLDNIVTKYGEIIALKNINLFIKKGEIVTLIGANGAGKTTTMKTISGIIKHCEGMIEFNNIRIDDMPGHKRVKLGIVHVPEGRDIFSPLTVAENLLMGAYLLKDKQKLEENRERVFDLFPTLKERRKQEAGTLSGGEQQMLAIGRSLMSHPILLMLDEPSLGLAPKMVHFIFDVLVNIHQESGTTMIIVEQNAQMALSVADRGYVLESGEIVLTGDSQDLLSDERVLRAYLGA